MSAAGKLYSLLKQYGLKKTVAIAGSKLKTSPRFQKKTAASMVKKSIKAAKLLSDEQINTDIKLSILTPVYNTDVDMLKCVIESVLNQTYPNVELCLADASDSEHPYVEETVKEYQIKDSRIKYIKLSKNNGISQNTIECIRLATGEYYGLLDHDDVLHPDAVYKMIKAIQETQAEFLYSDEATFEGKIHNIVSTNFKPDYSPESLRCNNYICHFTVFSRELYNRTGGFNKKYDGSQDHALILELTDKAKKVHHIPEILYFWRLHKESVGLDINAKKYAIDAGISAVKDFLTDKGIEATVESSEIYPTIYRIKYAIKDTPKVSIIILNKDHKEDLERCITSLKNSTYDNYEIVIVENNSTEDAIWNYYKELEKDSRIKIITCQGEFNYSAFNNEGVRNSEGKVLVFLNNDIEVINPSWIEEMLMYAMRTETGAVGARLFYPDRTLQHCYIITGAGEDRVAIHAGHMLPENDYGYLDRIGFVQNVNAVTAACMMVRRQVFEEAGCFDEELPVAYNDVDLCLKIRQKGYDNIYTPYATLYHHESVTRGKDNSGDARKRLVAEAEYMKNKWKEGLKDPYYNPNFSLERAYTLR